MGPPAGSHATATLVAMPARPRLLPGDLSAAIAARTERARRDGALATIPTREEVVPDAGIPFVVRVVAALARKREATRPGAANPFLAPDPALWVADVSDTYVCLLNKFNVVDGHALLVTRDFEEQESPLEVADFAALWGCLGETQGLGFYNSGAAAGASQRHRHLQLVPLPLGPTPPFPLEPSLAAVLPEPGAVATPQLPFPAALANLEHLGARSADEAAPALADLYREMLRSLRVAPGRIAYNLLTTRRLLWLVPRSRAAWRGLEVNALGFAGALLVADEEALVRLRSVGPLALLRAVSPSGRPV